MSGRGTSDEQRSDVQSGWHPVHVPHLVSGVVLAGLAVVWLLRATDVASHDDLTWLLPVPWVAAGLLGLIAVTTTGRRRRQPASSQITLTDGPETPGPDHEEQR